MSTEIAALLLIVVVVLMARIVYPGKDQNGILFDGPDIERADPSVLRVATFNIQTGKSSDGVRDIHRSAKVLSEVELAGIQEVYAPGWLNKLGIGDPQSHVLATQGNFSFLFATTRHRWFREHRGNLLLSKLKGNKWQVKMLSDKSRKSPRNMTIAELVWNETPFVFINTHLHTGKGRLQQLQEVLTEFEKHPRAILVGDFNTRRSSPVLNAALTEESIDDAIAQAGLDIDNPDRIDWILTKGFKVEGGKMIEKGISDHPYYEVSLRLKN